MTKTTNATTYTLPKLNLEWTHRTYDDGTQDEKFAVFPFYRKQWDDGTYTGSTIICGDEGDLGLCFNLECLEETPFRSTGEGYETWEDLEEAIVERFGQAKDAGYVNNYGTWSCET